jgi:hypothetical protein
VTVNYAVTGGTATGSGVDYTLASGTLSFAPGEISKSLTAAIVDDTVDEADETFIVTLSNPANASLGSNASHTYTILDNDDPETITVVSANGGENWQTGASYRITWTSGNVTGNVKIELSRNGGNTFETLFENTVNDGSESWTVTEAATAQALLRISSVGNPSVNDTSNNTFTISNPPTRPSITVLTPNGGETWKIGTRQVIRWASSNVTGDVKIRISRDGGATYKVVYERMPNTGSVQWGVTGPRSSQCLIQVLSVVNPAVSDASDDVFSITP